MALKFSEYDRRHYPIAGVREGYALWSRTYNEQVVGDLDLPLLQRLTAVSWRSCRCAVDLACGTGRIGSWLMQAGVRDIDGVDLTPEMLQHARDRNLYRTLVLGDIRDTRLSTGEYDLVISVLCDEHLPELAPLYGEAARLLRDGGRFVLIGYHPYFMLDGIPTHFRTADGRNQAIESHIHLLSDHVAAGRAHGLSLYEMLENVVDDAWIEQRPNWAKHQGKPVSFALVWAPGARQRR